MCQFTKIKIQSPPLRKWHNLIFFIQDLISPKILAAGNFFNLYTVTAACVKEIVNIVHIFDCHTYKCISKMSIQSPWLSK